jgi:hypothetical protein
MQFPTTLRTERGCAGVPDAWPGIVPFAPGTRHIAFVEHYGSDTPDIYGVDLAAGENAVNMTLQRLYGNGGNAIQRVTFYESK